MATIIFCAWLWLGKTQGTNYDIYVVCLLIALEFPKYWDLLRKIIKGKV